MRGPSRPKSRERLAQGETCLVPVMENDGRRPSKQSVDDVMMQAVVPNARGSVACLGAIEVGGIMAMPVIAHAVGEGGPSQAGGRVIHNDVRLQAIHHAGHHHDHRKREALDEAQSSDRAEHHIIFVAGCINAA
jgi:hypothetical protein